MADEKIKHRKTHEFDYKFSNGFGIAGGDNNVTILFSFEEPNFVNDEKWMLDQVGVVLSPKTAKLLWASLGEMVGQIEAEIGPIVVKENSDDRT